jgi:hypothetical protein
MSRIDLNTTAVMSCRIADVNFAFEDPTEQTYVTVIAVILLSISDVYKRYAVV